MLRRGGQLKSSPLRKRGRVSLEWEKFRNAEFEKDKDEEGLIRCQDTKIGLPHCGVSSINMDLHHTEGRDGKLLFDKSKMVWLTKQCHGKIHSYEYKDLRNTRLRPESKA